MNTENANIKVVQKKHESITLGKILIYIEKSLQYNKNEEVAPFAKLSTVRKYCCYCLGQCSAEFITANAI